MTQYLVEEALRSGLQVHEAQLAREAYAQAEQDEAISASLRRRDRAMKAVS